MNEQFKQDLIDWGVNWDDVKERFMGNEDLVIKFMLKFLNDKSFGELTEGLKEQNAEAAFKGCHSLKGVTGNLALDGMRPDVLELTEILRAGSLEGSDELYQKIKASYDNLIGILNKYS
ncbi:MULTISPECIES: Hpt domain-containing protein [unclassified Butyrivibrio]|uniref:Hpt domain-containing protein n=1 Tax=unclassified Butyrivibrio TaxID=2639466 RepID=UPI0004127F20|nr:MULTISPECIES: Hpt domain-containing protein [unclassified Butyrivibrio]